MGETAGGLKNLLARERRAIEALHREGALGGQVCSALGDLCDRVLQAAWREALGRVSDADRPRVERELALVAVGGYGRGDLSPFSDVDLLFLHASRPHPWVPQIISSLVRDLWDIGVKLSHSARAVSDAISFARQDLALRTSLIEARAVAGHEELAGELQRRFGRAMASASINSFIREALRERVREHQDYHAATVYLLEPNVKKSPGALRDLHLFRWVAFARYGTRDPEMLRASGVLSADDTETLARAAEFLYRVRHELHFHAGAAQDVLTRDEQVRLAQWLGYENQGPLLGVERFMQLYYRHTTAVHDVVMRFVDGARRRSPVRSLLNRLLTSRVEEHFLLSREHVAMTPEAPLDRAERMLRLFDLARQHGVSVAHETLGRVRAAAPACAITPEARTLFLKIFENPRGLGFVARHLHQVGLLGRLIPAFDHARGLMQFNQYHKYTVDEHSIRALEAAARRFEDTGPIGRAYRETRRKDVLHLAILLHDIGKGYEEDHSEVGRKIAEGLAAEVGLGEHERQQLVFLVHKHLFMAHVSQRRDVSDVQTIVPFVRGVGTVETLRMLYVLTAADTEAVAPGSLTGWKESLLNELYFRAMEQLTGESPVADEAERAAAIRKELREKLGSRHPAGWLDQQLLAMPLSYLQATPAETVALHLDALRAFDPAGVRVESRYLRDLGLTEYTVFLRDDLTPGVFSKISGVLAAERFQIVGARIVTRRDGLVIDTFHGIDLDFSGEPPAGRRRDVGRRIEEVLLGRKSVDALFAARRDSVLRRAAAQPPQVEIDNATSDRCTIVEVFADDRQGLLYVIAKALFELGLSVVSAKIGTHLDQVVDVFYVTAREGGKVLEEAKLEAVRGRLIEVIR